MSRLDELRAMQDFIGREIAHELADELAEVRGSVAMDAVCRLYGISEEAILIGLRDHQTTRARHALTWLLRQRGDTVTRIARVLGYSSKSSACQALKRVDTDPAMRALLTGLQVTA